MPRPPTGPSDAAAGYRPARRPFADHGHRLYIARRSPRNALAWEARLTAALDALGGFHSHAIDEDASERTGDILRKTVFERTYLIHYHVDADVAVVVASIRHGALKPRPGEP